MKFVSDSVLEEYIREDAVVDALHKIQNYIRDLPTFHGRSFERGYMKAYGVFSVGGAEGERPFDFAVNRAFIKCYIRKPGLAMLGPVGKQRVLSSFPAADILNGELRVNIKTTTEADELLRCLFEH
ncbi:hypothetical protein CKO35_06675 [Ectothiorhodospira shaposhnikovii]|uniref:hypothetical protein n=1 Tax=Ectothiorhodospira shaposhnikovii TaxID=1054 RepID=UPI001904FDC0|nr:hypothetical protein [Ectothiorhodospira shaposhnikovii]MBK1672994.1 hypothetical protein [Ectothiorhodospira shaposhnikovii]